jgi:hypothetical protein
MLKLGYKPMSEGYGPKELVTMPNVPRKPVASSHLGSPLSVGKGITINGLVVISDGAATSLPVLSRASIEWRKPRCACASHVFFRGFFVVPRSSRKMSAEELSARIGDLAV